MKGSEQQLVNPGSAYIHHENNFNIPPESLLRTESPNLSKRYWASALVCPESKRSTTFHHYIAKKQHRLPTLKR